MSNKLKVLLDIRSEGKQFATRLSQMLDEDTLSDYEHDPDASLDELMGNLKSVPLALLEYSVGQLDSILDDKEEEDECDVLDFSNDTEGEDYELE